MIYIYDGTWEGMMTMICRTAQEGPPEDVLRASPGGAVLLESLQVETDPALARATGAVLASRIGGRATRDAYLAVISEQPGIDLAVWRYLERLWREGRRAGGDLADECVGRVFHAARAAAKEYDRWMGMTRFQDVGGAYYAAIGPKCDVLPILANHFAGRLPDRWVLHDVRRGKAALHDGGRWVVTDGVPETAAPRVTEEERAFQSLWREFFRSVAIRERTNPRCQMNFLPKRVWRYLVERPDAP